MDKLKIDHNYKEDYNSVPLEEINNNGITSYGILLNEYSNEELPTVSIVTLTYNRDYIFDIAIRNWEKYIYPRDKLEWVIIDDSPKPLVHTLLKNKLGKELNNGVIKYIHLEKKVSTVSAKRNIACSHAENEIICFMDDDDYYYPDSVMNRVKVLLGNNKKVTGSVMLNCINLIDLTSYISGGSLIRYTNGDKTILCSEASLAFYKNFWERQKFDEDQIGEEIRGFLLNRTDDFINIPGSFVMVALSHGKNLSERTLTSSINRYNFLESLDTNTVNFLAKLQKNIFFTKDENRKAYEFQQKYNNIGHLNLIKKIKKLPEVVQMTPLIVDLRRKNPTVKSSDVINIVYISGMYIKNLNPFDENLLDEHEEQIMKIAEFYINTSNEVAVYLNCGTSGVYKTENNVKINYHPWWKYVPKNHSRMTIVYREYEFLKEINTNKLIYILSFNDINLENINKTSFDTCDTILVDHITVKFNFAEKTNFPLEKITIFPFFGLTPREPKGVINYENIISKININWDILQKLKDNYKVIYLGYTAPHRNFEEDCVVFTRDILNRCVNDDSIGCILISNPLTSVEINYLISKCKNKKIIDIHLNEVTDLLNNHLVKDNRETENILHELIKFL